MIPVLYEDNHVIVVEKPVNVPVQADSSEDYDLLTMIKDDLKIRHNKPGNVYLGLVHRLDRPVGGIMVFAKTSKAASRLSEQVRTRTIEKTYLAIVHNASSLPESQTLRDYLAKDHKTNTVSVVSPKHPQAKEAILSYELLETKEPLALVKVHLQTGRSHQIRVQFASRNHALWGDQRYNRKAVTGQQIALYAYQLSFVHPTTKEQLTFTRLPQASVWEEFDYVKS
ncbi:MAG: RluA family pseudouridine synthase [Erysipelotrichaceae bacterium]|nr:RluA family pseudouridine synthase [Erysipelotrichaceae bacterium]